MSSIISTYTGKSIDFKDPTQDDIDIVDIAHSLSMLCRWNGHGTKFYSVAEHSVLVSYMVPHGLALQALLHDAAEAYLGDLITPVKDCFPEFKEIEDNFLGVILAKFGQMMELYSAVKDADVNIRGDEYLVLIKDNGSNIIKYLKPAEANLLFLERFLELTNES